MKKIFIPHSFILFFTLLLPMSISCLFLYGIIYVVIHSHNDAGFVGDIIIFLLGFFTITFLTIRIILSYKITLNHDSISTVGDSIGKSRFTIQFKTKVKYIDIQNIEIICSTKNSKNKNSNGIPAPRKYLEFTFHDEKKDRICINFYTKKQILKMLNQLKLKIELTGNTYKLDIDAIMKDWYTYDGYLKLEKYKKDKNKK